LIPDNRNSLDVPRVSVLPKVAKEALIVIAGTFLVAALLCVLIFRMITWPYRSTHRDGHDRGARIEAAVALMAALTALVETFRRREALR
jgi:hypothetical protein